MIEDGAPNHGDGNNDGIIDSLQTNVASIQAADDSYVTIETSSCDLFNITVDTEESQSALDENYEYPLGLVDFSGNCTAMVVTLYAHGTDITLLRKINPAGEYVTIDNTTASTIIINSQEVTKIEYLVEDGGPLDFTAAGDGIVRDPVGFAEPVDAAATEENTEGPDSLIRTGGYDN